jgi:DNA-binding LacI/PurR family transcriptional regulator
MSEQKRVLFIGLDPGVVDYGRWPGLTDEKLRGALQADRDALEAAGYDVAVCFIDRGETAERAVGEALSATSYDAVMIGAGVRKDEEHFLLFEKVLNVVHRGAPAAKLCFNTGPTDSFAAVRRWI